MGKRLTFWIMIGLVAGLAIGWGLHLAIDDGSQASADRLTEIASYFSILTTLFLRLIKMIIAPLVFSTLVVGIAHMGDTAALGRVGLKSIGWFVCASLLSLLLGLLLVNLLQPGVGLDLPLPPVTAARAGWNGPAFNLSRFRQRTSFPPRWSMRWRPTRSCRSSCSRSSSAWRSPRSAKRPRRWSRRSRPSSP